MSLLGRAFLSLLLLVGSAQMAAQAEGTPSVRIIHSDPGLTGKLGDGQPLYLRLAYHSDRPIRVQVEGFAAGQKVGAMSNGMPLNPAGNGEALVWLAYAKSTTIDRLRIAVYDEKWREIHAVSVPVQLQWDTAVRRNARQPAAWAARMSEAQQRASSQEMEDAMPAGTMWLGLAFMAGVPAYFILQLWFAWGWNGGWRTAALVPLIVVVPALMYSLFALAQGSNLWPLALIFLTPLGFIYLMIVWTVRKIADLAAA
jgi:hypothetical protein